MDAPHQLAVGDDAAAHTGADDKHRRVAAALQRTGLQLCKGSGLAVIFQRDRKCPAVGDKAGAGVHKAGQGHGDAAYFIPVRRIQIV